MPKELPIVAGEIEEASKLFNISWLRPLLNGVELSGVGANTLSTHNVTEISYRFLGKSTLAELN